MLAEVVRERGSLTHETLKIMADFMYEGRSTRWIQDLAREIVGAATNPKEQAAAVWAWVRRNIQYREDPPGMEWVQSLEASLNARAGDCDDLATAAGALLSALGHRVVPVAVWWENRNRFTHAVLLDRSAGMIVDPVSPQFAPWPPMGRKIHALMEG